MYQLLLTGRYLTSKLMPLLAAIAVTLCTAMVLIVWSVMGGFLSSLLSQGRAFSGDVTVRWPGPGMAHYQDLAQRLLQDPAIAAAAPYIETLALASLPDNRLELVSLRGIDPGQFQSVVQYEQSLWWKPAPEPLRKDKARLDFRLNPGLAEAFSAMRTDGLRLAEPDPVTGELVPAVVPGIEMSGLSLRVPEGFYVPTRVRVPQPDGSSRTEDVFFPNRSITLRVVPLDSNGRDVSFKSRTFPVANEFRTGVYELDKRIVFAPFAELQSLLNMGPARQVTAGFDPFALDPDGAALAPVPTGADTPARATGVIIRGAPGATPELVRSRAIAAYARFAEHHNRLGPSVPTLLDMTGGGRPLITTFEMDNAVLVGAVAKETVLVLGILVFISLTASFLILAIFWAMVSEKTRDIGVLRSMGASGRGVAALWLAYGLGIGAVGSAAGGALAVAVIVNINAIHDVLAANNAAIWDPAVYYFSEIPSEVSPRRVAVVLGGGLLFAVLGALVPAVRAARYHPVKALGFE